MAVFGTAVEYGTGYVYGPFSYFIVPDSGPVTGGTEVVISGQSFLDTSRDDGFDDGVVNPALWTVTLVGAASSAVENGGRLHLQASPVAGSSAKIDSIGTLLDTDAEVGFSVVTPVASLPAPAPVELAAFRLVIDPFNYAQVARKTGGTFGDRYEVVVVVAGATIESAYLPTSDLAASLRIIRHGGTVYLYAGTTELLRRSGFPMAPATLRIAVDNLTAAYAVQTDFDDFAVHTMVTFGTEPMLDAQVPTADRILGTTPPGARVEEVDLSFAVAAGPLPLFPDAFEYLDPAQFTVMAPLSGELVVSFSNDPVLRNLVVNRPGFLR